MFKLIVQKYLEHLTKRYLKRHKPQLVAVVGSVGKTGTKIAIATVLSEKYRVRLHEANHNTPMSVPLSVLGVEYPENVHSARQWWAVFQAARFRIKSQKDVDVIVQELGTDHPGDIKAFSGYLRPGIAVVTAVSDEHMEFFPDLNAVAKEELAVAGFSQFTIINRDDVDERFAKLADTHNLTTYGLGQQAEYRLDLADSSPLDGRTGKVICPEWGEVPINLQLIGVHNAKAAAAAVAVAAKLGLTSQQTAVGVAKIKPTAGRMSVLRGLEDSVLIDDSYNSSPLAAKLALETLYQIEAPQRIAILGSMNELGRLSAQAHEALGKLCESSKLDWVVTIGEDAELYLAPAAKERGCQVRSFKSAIDAGGFVHSVMKPGAVILAKGSQDQVYAEEALKVLLHNTEEEASLVRQSPAWLAKKQAYFSSL